MGCLIYWRTGKRHFFEVEGIADANAQGLTYHVPYYTSLLAQIHARDGDFQSALALCIDARERGQLAEEYLWEAELHRNEGEVRRAAGHPLTDVEDCFGRALDVSRRQGARMFELRAAASLARLWCDQGKLHEARNLLGPVYSGFTEGFDTVDLKEAKVLLNQLNTWAISPLTTSALRVCFPAFVHSY